MFRILFLLFLCIPVIEIFLFIEIGGLIGTAPTLALIVVTAVIGAQLLKIQGLSTLQRAKSNLNENKIPAQEIVEGIALLISGAFLLTPGFFTDTIGFILVIPHSRKIIAKWIISKGTIFFASSFTNKDENFNHFDDDIIEGEYTKEEPNKDNNNLPEK